MKKHLYIFFLLLITSISLNAQQLPIFTNYTFNDYIINPAIGGIHDYYQVKTTFRQQWVNLDGAPTTYILSTYGPHSSMDMGFGGYIFNDNMGAISNTGIYGSYAYNFQIFNDIRLSLGMFVGGILWDFDPAEGKLKDATDILNNSISKFHPDASFGAYVYTSQWDVGFSANQLLMTRVDEKDSLDVASRLTSHFYLTGRYRYNLNRDIDLEGSTWIRYARPSAQVDLSVKGIYQKLVWAGISWRTSDAVSVLLGWNQGILQIGYSYDVTTSALRQYSSGTHEVVIGVRFANIKSSKRGGRSRSSIRR